VSAASSDPASSRPGGPAGGFPVVGRFREGYAAEQVDAFVADVERAFDHDPPAMAPYEVADQRFRVSRRGRRYDLRQVDGHLEQLQGALRERHGGDAVAAVEASVPSGHGASTWWIYLLGLLIVAALVIFALTQL
jgi:hypothetical protein